MWLATIVVPFVTKGGAISAVAPFYVAVSGGGSRARVVTPRHHGVPRRGFVASGARLGDALRAAPLAAALVDLARRFMATNPNH